ncbi:MAG TPA: branched-chain amino acid ABC transporter permease [Actinomycetota bacterium]
MDVLVEILVRGAQTSAVLALLALGFSLVYGVGGVVNLAHGSLFMVGAYAAVAGVTTLGLPLWLAYAFGVAVAGASGAVLYLLIVRPVRRDPLTVLIVTLGAAIFIAALVRFLFGTANRGLGGLVGGSFSIFGVRVQQTRMLAFVVGVLAVGLLLAVLRKTAAGRIVRAVAQDPEAAILMGIDPGRVLLAVMTIGGALAGLAGVTTAPFEAVFPDMWLRPLTMAFAIVILGGLGSVEGTVLAAVLLGFLDRAVAFGLPSGERYVDLIAVLVILGTLVVRPQGIVARAGAHH